MVNGPGESATEAEPPVLQGMRVERLPKPDGRSILYYSWPDEPDPVEGRTDGTEPEPDV
jgi:hypothetical protein